MLFLLFISLERSLQHCGVALDNVKGLQSMKEILAMGCDNISLTGVTSAASEERAFCDLSSIGNTDELLTISFTDCDFSKSNSFILGLSKKNIEITIKNTNIGNGFESLVDVSSMTFIDCVIDITVISNKRHSIASSNISFVNCKLIGKIEDYSTGHSIIDLCHHYYSSDNRKEFNINFIDCEFNLENNWNKKEVNNDLVEDPKKLFIIIGNLEFIKVNINFIKCYPGENEVNKNLKIIKLTGREYEDNVKITGEDNGLDVEWTWVKDSQQFGHESEWSTVINSTGYYPTQNPTIDEDTTSSYSHEEEEKNSNEKNDSKTWKITTIVFIVAFVVAVVVFIIVLIILKRKNYDRSDNE